MTLATISFLCPLAVVLKKPMNVVVSLYLTTIVAVLAVFTTRIGREELFINCR